VHVMAEKISGEFNVENIHQDRRRHEQLVD
jgi:hypothetical protein